MRLGIFFSNSDTHSSYTIFLTTVVLSAKFIMGIRVRKNETQFHLKTKLCLLEHIRKGFI